MKTKHLFLVLAVLVSGLVFSQIPILNSDATITSKVIYLDFDGQVVSGTGWDSGNTINAMPSGFGASDIRIIWQRVSEDYRPFDVNITTDSVRFNNAPPNKRMRVIITPTSSWYAAAGGVAFVGSFAWGGTPGTPCWIFEDELNFSARSVAEACSHEAGHTLSLKHQSTYNSSCTKTAEYNPGQGTGVTSWAPIMGVGYYKNVTTWYTGKSSLGCTTIQYDHSNAATGITGIPYLNFLPDDVGDTYATSKILNLTTLTTQDSGLITTPADIDVYKFTICNSRYVSVAVKPWALDTTNYNGANLDIRYQLYDASNNALLLTDTLLTKLNTLKGSTLPAGSYYFTIDGGRSANYSDYGSLGKYYIKIKATNPPALANTIVTSTAICTNQNTTLNYTSNGTPTSWVWTISGAGNASYTTQNPVTSFSTAGVYTITLLATSTSSTSCETNKVITVGAVPALAVSSNTAICPGPNYLQLVANGADSYVWLPGNYGGSGQLVNPTTTSSYTVTGSNGLCSTSSVITVSVVPDFTMNVVTTNTLLCPGGSATITATGASSYTVVPGNTTGSVTVVSPAGLSYYYIYGTNGACTKSVTKTFSVSPSFSIDVVASSAVLCEGETVTLTASGADSFTFNPGNITSNPAVITPNQSVTYTITGQNAALCLSDTLAELVVTTCEYTGIKALNNSSAISIYPNPASGDITIATAAGCTKIEIINALGSLVFEKNNVDAATFTVAAGNWANGVYFARVYAKGADTIVQKIIVKN